MKAYLDLLQNVIDNGVRKESRAKVNSIEMPTRTVFGRQLRFDLAKGFPLVTTKKMSFKIVTHEVAWMLSGDTNVQYLQRNGVSIWDEWADSRGELGPIYGHQWRNWNSSRIDQVDKLVNTLRANPNCRRAVVSAWNPEQLNDMALPPCHIMWQCIIIEGRLNMHCLMRSVDVFLGLPYNIAFYALLAHIMAVSTGSKIGDLVMSLVDTHVYENHLDVVVKQLDLEPHPLPKLILEIGSSDFRQFTPSCAKLSDYTCEGPLKAEVAI